MRLPGPAGSACTKEKSWRNAKKRTKVKLNMEVFMATKNRKAKKAVLVFGYRCVERNGAAVSQSCSAG